MEPKWQVNEIVAANEVTGYEGGVIPFFRTYTLRQAKNLVDLWYPPALRDPRFTYEFINLELEDKK